MFQVVKVLKRISGIFLVWVLVGLPSFGWAQTGSSAANAPSEQTFAPALQYLASPGFEGREAGTAGCNLAAGYIAAMMQQAGLTPFNCQYSGNRFQSDGYFQTFRLIRNSTTNASFAIDADNKRARALQLVYGQDFTVENTFTSVINTSVPVFVGYGINTPELGFNDYKSIDVKGRIVLLFDGYPGQNDTLSATWNKFRTAAVKEDFGLTHKCREAARQGAAAIIVIPKNYLLHEYNDASVATENEPLYPDAGYFLPTSRVDTLVPCILLTASGSTKLVKDLKIQFGGTEIANLLNFSAKPVRKQFNINLQVNTDTLIVQNVIGLLPGTDTSTTIILGAHYDHLGKRGDYIYSGADDNASGVAGLLALAGNWAETNTAPPCNILFASWTAEEKGLIGSEYFAGTFSDPAKVKLYINMDMISRSVKEDTAGRQLSIGTRTTDEYLRELARKCNSTLDRSFTLDLWDVTGHSGSDYASFTAKNIPVMTYNTGLHDDYHTKRDIPASADLVKMGDVLKLINISLQEVFENYK